MTFLPCPAMIPERIGTMGSTQGVKASTRPARKKPPSMMRMFPERASEAYQSCSETKPEETLLASPAAPADPEGTCPGGRLTRTVFVTGG